VTIRIDIWTTNTRSLGFQDSKECVTLWKLILWSLRYIASFARVNNQLVGPTKGSICWTMNGFNIKIFVWNACVLAVWDPEHDWAATFTSHRTFL
jgi:hypothetical protein